LTSGSSPLLFNPATYPNDTNITTNNINTNFNTNDNNMENLWIPSPAFTNVVEGCDQTSPFMTSPLFSVLSPSNMPTSASSGSTPFTPFIPQSTATPMMMMMTPFIDSTSSSASSFDGDFELFEDNDFNLVLNELERDAAINNNTQQTPLLPFDSSPATTMMRFDSTSSSCSTIHNLALQQHQESEQTVSIPVKDLEALLRAVQLPILQQATISAAIAAAVSNIATPSPAATSVETVTASPAFSQMATSPVFGYEESPSEMNMMEALFGAFPEIEAVAPAPSTAEEYASGFVDAEDECGLTHASIKKGPKSMLNTTRDSTIGPTKRNKGDKIRRRPSKLYQCSHSGCSRAFSRAFNLKVHEQTHEENRDRPFACEHPGCNKTFVRVHDLIRHNGVHLDVKAFVCVGCGKGFTRKDALRRHVGSSAACTEKEMEMESLEEM
jgi:hypothetical protein